MKADEKIIIPGYDIGAKLGESPQSVVYKACRKGQPQQALVLKILRSGYLSEHQKTYYRQKIEHLKVLSDPMLPRPIAFEVKRDVAFITREYFEGETLNGWVAAKGKISLQDFFTIGRLLAQAISKVHDAGIIHGGIKPHNILINPKSLNVRIIDFMSALDVREVSHFIYDRSFVAGTLAYTSPEQTGRINHRVGFYSDIYSLGIVFYEMLSGRLPFFSLDPLELIHSHLAEEAEDIHDLNPEIPEVLAKIIAKLICKQPEKRYQRAQGLLADLTRCQAEYLEKTTILPFPLDNYNYAHRVSFISKMVGRETETNTSIDEFNVAAGGAFCALFISGLPGIGKTRLIQELQRPIVRQKGYFTSGKFDLYQRNIPYSALIQCIGNLLRTFLTESDERLEGWKKKILKAVGINGRVLADVIPEFGLLVGPQPEVEALPPVEARNRFNYVFNEFLICLASEENPLTVFIDDLQWCDTATFEFLANIFANHNDYKYLFFLGAYRSNEVDSSHPLSRLIREIGENRWPLKEIRLGPLEPKHCHEMVSYILDSNLPQTKELSSFITELSEGNPLFVGEILSYLHNENLLSLDEKRLWRWNLEKIRESDMPSTVVALFSSKVRKLPSLTVELLEYCACMGNRFSPTEIALAKDITLFETFKTLKEALAQGLLMENKDELQFVHDRVQEAVLFAIEPEKRRRLHWEIGTHLLHSVEGQDLEKLDNIFTIAAHLNLGKENRPSAKTAYQLTDVNYHAGNKALQALASEAAKDYFRTAINLLPGDSWQTQYERTFEIYEMAAKTELMCGNYDISEKILNQLLENARTDLDKADCLAKQTTSLSSIGNFIKAIETANRGLAYFGKAIPTDPQEAEKKREQLMKTIEFTEKDVWNTILNMPFTDKRQSKIELSFYSELIPDLYMSGLVSQLYLSAVQSTQHCLAGGMDESVIYSFSIMGLYLGEQEKFKEAFKYEDLAHDLCEKYPNTFGATRGMNGIVWCNMHSRSAPKAIVDYCLKSVQCGRNSGDLYNAGLSYGPLMWNLQVQGADFREIERYASECLEFSKKYHLFFSVGLADAMLAGWIEPMKKEFSPVDMEAKIKQWENNNHVASAGSYYVNMALIHYYFGDYEKAEHYLQGVKRYLTGLTDNVLKRQWHVFLILNALQLHELGIKYSDKDELNEYIRPLIRKVETWAGLGPLLKPYLAMAHAEIERVTGNPKEAVNLYLEAIASAHKHDYTFLEGYLNESLGVILEKGEITADGYESPRASKDRQGATAGILFREAARLYRKCGAERKEMYLVEKRAAYFEEEPSDFKAVELEGASYALPNLDVEYLMKSSLAIQSEVEEQSLLRKIMDIVLEASGAQHGYLMILENNDLIIRASSHAGEHVVSDSGQRLDKSREICRAIVRYVLRTKETVILENAAEEGAFKNNPEVMAMKLRSVFCAPVIKQSELVGILYLENRLSDVIFTPEKSMMTRVLANQAAISLENARMMDRMKLDIVERKRAEDNLARKAEELARSNADLEQFAYVASHDLQEPLRMVASYVQLLARRYKGQLDDNALEFIGFAVDGANRMKMLINDLLAFSRVGIGGKPLDSVDAQMILDEALANLKTSIQESGAVITHDKLPVVTADKLQFVQVFQNLIGNAIKFRRDESPRIVIGACRKGNKWLFSVADNGMGFDPVFSDRIFLLFQRLHSRTMYPGTGIGLTICKKIVERHGGRIWVETQPGKGSTFYFTIPEKGAVII